MVEIKELKKAIEQLSAEKDLDAGQVTEAVEAALASAYKKEYERKGEVIRATLNEKTGDVDFVQVKTVVDDTVVRFPTPEEEQEQREREEKEKRGRVRSVEREDVMGEREQSEDQEEQLPLYNPARHILLEEAKQEKADVVLGDEIVYALPAPPEEFGRIAAQTAKQVILQRIREIEKGMIKQEFEGRIGELVTGTVQRVERGNVYVDLGKASGIMFFSEAIAGEHYRIGERLRFFLSGVQEGGRTPTLLLSRTHPRFIAKLFELEVPEIADGVVEVKDIVREPGQRTKIAVASTAEGVDPVGACVGQRGSRVMAVNNELGNEKIDIIEWSQDPSEYIGAALSPAQVSSVELVSENSALVLVPQDQLSLAIGKGGQNVRLAAKMTGWRIDVRSQTNPEERQDGGVADLGEDRPESALEEVDEVKAMQAEQDFEEELEAQKEVGGGEEGIDEEQDKEDMEEIVVESEEKEE